MARDFDNFPTYDPVIKAGTLYLSSLWSDFMTTFIESLRDYLSQNGIFIPNMSLAERNQIQSPQEGQLIYVTDANTPTLPRTGEVQVWKVLAGVGSWTVIV